MNPIPHIVSDTKANAGISGDRGSCTINGLANATGLAFDICQQIGMAAGRRKGRGYWPSKIIVAAKRYGIKTKKLRFRRITLQKFIKNYPVGKFYVSTNYHAYAVVDGIVKDWMGEEGSIHSRPMSVLTEAFQILEVNYDGRTIIPRIKKTYKEKIRDKDRKQLKARPTEYQLRNINKHGDADLEYFSHKHLALAAARQIVKNKGAVQVTAVWNAGINGRSEEIYCRGKKLWLKRGGWI
jgi:hypothetical protein